MPNPGAYQRAPSVNPAGTVFLARGGKGCGAQVEIVRIGTDGAETVLTQFPPALDTRDTYAYTDENGVTHLDYERFGCGKKTGSDIFQVLDPELASLTVNTAGSGSGTVTSSPPGITCGSDCSEQYPGGTGVTLLATADGDSYVAGWTGGGCTGTGPCTVTMDQSKSVTATFELTGSIAVIKDAVPDDAQNFVFDPSPNLQAANFTLDDDADPTLPNVQTFTGLTAGTYTVAEIPAPGWQIADLACVGDTDGDTTTGMPLATINLDPGEHIVCTYVNAREGSITIAKDSLPDHGQFFEFDPSPNLQTTNFLLDDDPGSPRPNQETFLNLGVPATYSVQEVNIPGGWALTDIRCAGGGPDTSVSTVMGTATIGLDAGEAVVCTFENTKQGSITIVKDAIGDDPQDFGFSATGGLAPSSFSLDDDADPTLSNQRVYTGLLPGTFTVTEGSDPTGWQLTDIVCTGGGPNTTDAGRTATIGLDPGENVTCTFTNTQGGTVTVIKDAVPNSPQDFGFTTTGGLSPSTFTLDDDGAPPLSNQRVFADRLPGTYTVTEDADPSGWQLTDLVCTGGGLDTSVAGRTATIGLDPEESVVCTFTNTEEGSITIALDTVPDDRQDFEFTATGLTPSAFTLDDDGDLPFPSSTSDTRVFSGVLPGTYDVIESVPLLWQLASIVCVDPDSGSTGNAGTFTATVDLDAGEVVTCTFTNSLLP